MKIVYVITPATVIGGASVHVLDLAAGAQRAGHEVVILGGGTGVFMQRAKQMGLQCIPLRHLVRSINPVEDLLGFFELRRQFRALGPQIVHLHSSKAGILGRLAARTLSIPAVFTAHGWAFTEGIPRIRRYIYKVIEKWLAPLAAQIITVSEYDKKLAIRARVGSPGLITAIHNGMPVLPDAIDCVSERNASDSKPADHPVKMIMVARFDLQKNQSDLLDALASLLNYPWVMEFVGEGRLLPQMKEKSIALGLQDRVVFSGNCNDVAERLCKADVFVLASNWEGLPLSILEAMRAGLPVIASQVGGVPEAVIDGDTGYLVQPQAIGQLSLAIEQLITNPDLRISMGQSGRRRFLQVFTFEKMLNSTLAVYHAVLGAR